MKINKRNETIDDECKKTVKDILKEISYFLENYDKLTNKDYYNMICNFYEIKLEDSDYIEYINFKTGNDFNKIVKLKTDVINSYRHTEGHGRDFSWWDEKSRLCLNVATNGDLENTDKYYTIDEIKNLIKENKIYPVRCFGEKCDDRLYVHGIKNDIEYLIKSRYGKLDLDIDDEYFDYFISNIINEVDFNEMFMNIRKYIVSHKIYLECGLIDYYFDDENEKRDRLDRTNKLIDSYNKIILSQNNIDEDKKQLISKNSVEIVIEYLKSLPNIDESKWYQDIEIEQVVKVVDMIDYDKEKELCSEIQGIIINLGDPELCYLMARDIYWIDLDKMLDVIIDSEDEWVIYDVLSDLSNELDDATIKKLLQIIIDSENPNINYKVVYLKSLNVNVKEHGEAVIKSGSVWYNYLFAINVPGADVKRHGEVIIKYGSAYDNSEFITYVKGADIDRHREAIKIKQEEENKNNLKRVKTKTLN